MADDYRQKQAKRDREYAEEYDRWVASMTPEERKEALKCGLIKPDLPKRASTVSRNEDASTRAISLVVEQGQEKPQEAQSLEAIRMIVATLIPASNLKLSVVALAYAAGLSTCAMWRSQSDCVRKEGFTSRSALNKAIQAWMKALNLPPNQYTVGVERKEKLSKAQIKNHWRNRHFKAREVLA